MLHSCIMVVRYDFSSQAATVAATQVILEHHLTTLGFALKCHHASISTACPVWHHIVCHVHFLDSRRQCKVVIAARPSRYNVLTPICKGGVRGRIQ